MRWLLLAFLIPVTLFAQTSFRHRLNWGTVDAVSGYKVYRSLNNAAFLLMQTTTNTTVSFTNTASALYRYRVTSYNSFGESLPSNEVAADMRTSISPTNLVLTIEIIVP